ncbi:hypothetical protein F4781DRAFT_46676 [Annulohypoxylon bovei var. microspora]|nr:hypothetical protein F4781DRAFT_46676 [Annulohypoxylon bovei var. microspora]
MFGKGSIEDAKALQADFKGPKSPRRKGRSRSRGNGPASRRGNRGGGGGGGGGGARLEPFGQQSNSQHDRFPAPSHAPTNQRLPPSRGPYSHYTPPIQRLSPRRTPPGQGVHPRLSPYTPPVQRLPPPQPRGRNGDLLDFNQSPPPRNLAPRQENEVPQQRRPASLFHRSILDEEEGEISQPVMQFTSKKESLETQKADVAMSGTDQTSEPGTPPRYGGLRASRWNSENADYYGSSYMDVDESSPEKRNEERDGSQRRGPAPAGHIVSSGMSKGFGLSSSRWA